MNEKEYLHERLEELTATLIKEVWLSDEYETVETFREKHWELMEEREAILKKLYPPQKKEAINLLEGEEDE